MPFIAQKDSTTVIPEAVSDGVSVECPTCGGEMRARGPFEDGRARHFFHISTSGGGQGCGGGESDPHRKMKSMAVSGLRHLFDSYRRCEPEVTLDVTQTPTDPDVRRADALVEFDETDAVYGKGVIVEVQYRNKTKDVRATAHDYLSLGYSVYWATEDDFTEDRFVTDKLTTAFDEQDEPIAYAPSYSTLPSLPPRQTWTGDDRETTGPWTRADPAPDCQHEYLPQEDVGVMCLRCGLEAEHRYYDESINRYRRPSMYSEQSNREKEFVFDRRTLSNSAPDREFIESGDSDYLHVWRWVNDIFGGTKYSCRHCKAMMIVTNDKVQIKHDGGDSQRDNQWRSGTTTNFGEADCNHDWESRGVGKVCTECGKEVKPWKE